MTSPIGGKPGNPLIHAAAATPTPGTHGYLLMTARMRAHTLSWVSGLATFLLYQFDRNVFLTNVAAATAVTAAISSISRPGTYVHCRIVVIGL